MTSDQAVSRQADRENLIREMVDALRTIADFAPGHGDVCEIIAQRARAALFKAEAQDYA